MMSAKKFVKMARKWQKFAAMKTKRISFHRNVDTASNCSTSLVADKGHFVVYTADQKCFMIPLAYLDREIMRELFKLSKEEFGLPSDGPITFPCDLIFMEYIVSLIQRGVAKDLEKALLMSVATSLCSSSVSSFHHGKTTSNYLCIDLIEV